MNFAREIMRQTAQMGYVFNVGDEEGRLCQKASFKDAWEHVTSVDSATVNFIKEGEPRECMLVINEGLVDAEETAADFSCDGVVERIWNELFEKNGG